MFFARRFFARPSARPRQIAAICAAALAWTGLASGLLPASLVSAGAAAQAGTGDVIIHIGPSQTVQATTARQIAVCQWALRYLTQPLPPKTDASGFIQMIYAHAGIKLPRTIAEQARTGKPIRNRDALRPGDLVFFSADNASHAVTFVGIYLPDSQVLALTTHGVRMFSLRDPYWSPKFQFGTRVL
ncbi:hypothetical protein GCM10010885_23690 [Alicyclobacillus cellulosilyticus]|uniref:NlpC/P60 domain-containing protein n=1 Tax=Alicyclobacillus cellulosilyticus TaxID=1003997 RepID=A0A917KH96_9BACL|nr:C40 family peptidase [Alicyclobacillus cellulosilyticus]GGJ13650.1 hypothetical protein GCM10010885_23690 [Alicyclobacillus cellulosilyticus]